MNIELKKLELLNFKGIKEKTIEFGRETNIFGRNETGKTTIFDSFTWLLFGKDSSNRSDFNIKTIDKNGEFIHGLEHQVIGVLDVDGKEVVLRRLLKENWVKKRGFAETVFSGNTTEYFINEEPKKEKDYKEYINSLIDENVFKLLTNPMHFNVNTSWQDRRKILLSIVGDVSDEEVINNSIKLKKLPELLNGNSIDSFKAIIASKKKKLNEQLKAIPIRIDEINRNLPVLAESVDYELLEKERANIKGELNVIESQLENQQRIAEAFIKRQSELSVKKNKLKDLELQIEKDSMRSLNEMSMKLMELGYKKDALERRIKQDAEIIAKNQDEIQRLQDEMQEYRDEYKRVFEEPFNEPDRENFVCPTCKQALPQDDIERQISGLLANYKSNKLKRLDEISNQGKWRKARVKQLQDENDRLNIAIQNNEAELIKLDEEIKATQAILNAEKNKEHNIDYHSNAEYTTLEDEIKKIEKNLLPLEQDSRVRQKREELQDRLQEINTVLSNKQVIEDSKLRIKELEDEERIFSQQIAELEGQEFLAEEFIKAKVSMLENKINNTFKYVTFKMFDVQINGGITETCQALIKGVPFADANNAAKYNAGIDVINALSKFYGTTAPVLIDNREGILELIDTDSQIINLIVSKKDKVLRIEVNESIAKFEEAV
jgi:DNA repair exonuclease SbcCD ATPase subunit